MVDTDDNRSVESEKASEKSYADIPSASNNSETATSTEDDKLSFGSELAAITIKTIAVVLSVVALIISILTVVMPLSAMRTYNKLGMSERALESGERYIASRLDDYDADKTDGKGQYVKVTATSAFADDDMLEALGVCLNLSQDLMDNYVDSDADSAEYFAKKLDKFARIYMSLKGSSRISELKSQKATSLMKPIYRPYVYNYAHTIMTTDFRARVYMGKTDKMMYTSNTDGIFMTDTSERSHSLSSADFRDPNIEVSDKVLYVNWFVDYIDQLNVYLGVQLERLGVDRVLKMTDVIDTPFENILTGKEFELFVVPGEGFTTLFTELKKMFTQYAQMAVDIPTNGDIDKQLRQLYWLRIIGTAADSLWNMGILTNYSRNAYGAAAGAVEKEFGDHVYDYFDFVSYNGERYVDISTVYNDLMKVYLDNFDNE